MAELEWQADVGAILELLSHHLYPRRLAYLRELVSNAIDATLSGTTDDAGVDIELADGWLVVEDHGRGLRPEDVGSLIGRIGMSGTASLHAGQRGQGTTFLGAFGVGLLSVRTVAEVVEIRSRHRDAPSGIRLEWDGGPRLEWTLDPTKVEPGTRVALRLRPSEASDLTHATIAEFLRRHVPHVPVPIRLQGRCIAGHPVPWRAPALDLLAWCRGVGMDGVLDAAMATDARGSAVVVAIPGATARGDESHRIHRSGVLVPGLGALEIAPAFRWLACIADLPWLAVTLNREGPTEPGRDEATRTLDALMGSAFAAAIVGLGSRRLPDEWWKRHRRSLMAAIAKLLAGEPSGLERARLGEWLPFRSSAGTLPLASLGRGGPVAFFREVQGDARSVEPTAAGRTVIVVESGEEEQVLVHLARAAGITLEQWWRGALQVDPGPGTRHCPEVIELVRQLDRRLSAQGIGVRIDATFEGPHGLASWLRRPGWLAEPRASTYDPEWLKPELGSDGSQPTLGINPWSPVIQALARAIDAARAGAVGALLVEIASLGTLGPNLHASQHLKRRLLESICAIAEIVPPPIAKPRFFVAYDWTRDRPAFEVVRDVMVGPPFEWELVHPLEQQSGRYILENVRACLGRAHVVVSVISGDEGPWTANPNVLLEAGMTEGMGGRVHVVCQRKGTRAMSDIQGLLRVEYESTSELRAGLRRTLDARGLDRLVPASR